MLCLSSLIDHIMPNSNAKLLTDHFRDVARRYAKEGFVAFAIDLVSRKGGTSATDAAANTGALGSANPDDLIADMQSAVTYLRTVLKQAALSEQFKTSMANLGQDIEYLDQPEFAKFWDEDAKRVEAAVQAIGKV